MLDYKTITLSHASVKVPLTLPLGSIGGYHTSPSFGWTQIYTNSGIFPVEETPEQITALINKQVNAQAPVTSPAPQAITQIATKVEA